MRVEWSLIHDFVIVRSDGAPIFFLANAVDDLDMGITHVIRGEDLIDSTHRVLALRHALVDGPASAPPDPQFAHLPLIVDAESRAKLSKRHGAVALEDFVTAGYLPEALTNYLALLGWAPADDGHEVMGAAELVAAVRPRPRHPRGGRLRPRQARLAERRVDPPARARRPGGAASLPMARGALRRRRSIPQVVARGGRGIAQERAATLVQIVDQMAFLFVGDDEFEIAPESWEKVVGTDRIAEILDAVIAHVETCEWTVDALALQPVTEALGIKFRKAAPAVYAAVEGIHRGLPLFDSMQLLGRDRTLARLRAASALPESSGAWRERGAGPLT